MVTTIYCFGETWLSQTANDEMWNIDKNVFEIIRCDRHTESSGSGLLALVPKFLKPHRRIDMDKLIAKFNIDHDDENIQSFWL